MALPITDSFDRADTTTGIGNADTGQTWVQQDWTGIGFNNTTAKILSNAEARVHTGSLLFSAAAVYVIDAGTADMDVTIVLSGVTTAGYAGILARYTDANNFIEVINADNIGTLIRKRVGGTYTTLYSDSVSWNVADTLELICNGNNYTYKRNGTTVTTFTDSSLSGTKVGHVNYMDNTGDWYINSFSAVAPSSSFSRSAGDTAGASDTGSVSRWLPRSTSDPAATTDAASIVLVKPSLVADAYITENVGIIAPSTTREADAYITENVGIIAPSTTREADAYIVLDQLPAIFTPQGIAYGYANVGLELVGRPEGIAYGYYGEVTEDQPTPCIWYITPTRVVEHSHAEVMIVGIGFGTSQGQYDGEVILDRVAVPPTNILDWTGLPASGSSPMVIEPDHDVADPEHDRITILVPDEAVTGLIEIDTHKVTIS